MASKQDNGKQTRQDKNILLLFTIIIIKENRDKVQTKMYKQQNEIQEKNNKKLHYYYYY